MYETANVNGAWADTQFIYYVRHETRLLFAPFNFDYTDSMMSNRSNHYMHESKI